jgi:hypothetical protein
MAEFEQQVVLFEQQVVLFEENDKYFNISHYWALL